MKALAGIDLMVIVTAPGEGAHDVVSRVFVPAWGVDEDPVTGSAHAALTPFWCERLGRDSFIAYQASRRGGVVRCQIGRAHVGTPVTNAHLVCRLLLEKKKTHI